MAATKEEETPIIVAKGKPYEFEVDIVRYKGKAGRKRFNKLLAFFLKLSAYTSEGDMMEAILDDDLYEDVFIPMVLNPHGDKEITAKIEECESWDLFPPFFEMYKSPVSVIPYRFLNVTFSRVTLSLN